MKKPGSPAFSAFYEINPLYLLKPHLKRDIVWGEISYEKEKKSCHK